MSDLIEDEWILISLSIQFVAVYLVEVCEENSGSSRFIVGREEYISDFFQIIVNILWYYIKTQQVEIS